MITHKIILLRGLGAKAFSSGIDTLASKLKAIGFDTWVMNHNQKRQALKEMVRARPGKVILVGHSMGATAAVDLAQDLIDAGIDVAMLATLDLHLPRYTPMQVPLCLTWWQNGRIALVKPLYQMKKAQGYKGKFIPTVRNDLKHITLDDDPRVHSRIIEHVQDVLGQEQIVPDVPSAQVVWTDNRFDREVFFNHVRKAPFNGSLSQDQVDGMNRLLDVWEKYCPDWDMRELAYDLGTGFHETGTKMEPIMEGGGREYFKKYEFRTDLGNTETGDGYKFRGAGDVQNTGRRNAKKATNELNKQFDLDIDLIANPEHRLDPLVSALSLFLGNRQGWWTGRKLPNYAGYGNWDMKGARSVVNGTDRWRDIGGYAGSFLNALKAASVQTEAKSPIQTSKPPLIPVPVDPVQPLPPVLAPGDALTLENLRKVPSVDLRSVLRVSGDTIKLISLVLDERANEADISVSKPAMIEVAKLKGNDMNKVKKWWQSMGMNGGLTALISMIMVLTGWDIPVEQVTELGNKVVELVGIAGAILAMWGRLRADARIG